MPVVPRVKILARYTPVPESGCWIWDLSLNSCGYGVLYVGDKQIRAHRYFYEHLRGQIPEGFVIDHLCKVRCCVNPDHMEIVTFRENVLRGESPSANYARREHCKHGHLLVGDNVYINQRYPNRRQCRTCNRDRQARLQC